MTGPELWVADDTLVWHRRRAELHRAQAAMCEAPADRDHWLALARQHDARAEVEVRAIQRSNRENQR